MSEVASAMEPSVIKGKNLYIQNNENDLKNQNYTASPKIGGAKNTDEILIVPNENKILYHQNCNGDIQKNQNCYTDDLAEVPKFREVDYDIEKEILSDKYTVPILELNHDTGKNVPQNLPIRISNQEESILNQNYAHRPLNSQDSGLDDTYNDIQPVENLVVQKNHYDSQNFDEIINYTENNPNIEDTNDQYQNAPNFYQNPTHKIGVKENWENITNIQNSRHDITILRNQNFAEIMDAYIRFYNDDKNSDLIDNTYGPKYIEDNLTLGNAFLQWDESHLKIRYKSYLGSAGLCELIFKRVPDQNLYSTVDLRKYGSILRSTNVYKRNFTKEGKFLSPDKNVQYKFRQIVEPAIASTGKHVDGNLDIVDFVDVDLGNNIPDGGGVLNEDDKGAENKTDTGKTTKIPMTELLVKSLAELMGTAMLLFLGCMGCVTGLAQTHLAICINFGLAVMLLIQTFGHISGCHINPAVTIAALIMQTITPIVGAAYIASQFLGAFLGFGLLKLVTPASMILGTSGPIDLGNSTDLPSLGFCTNMPHAEISEIQAAVVEFVATGVLAWVCCAVWDHRNANHHDSVPIKFGLTIAGLALATGPYSGASFNTARTFAPALWNSEWDHHWVYWVGPNLGSVVFTLFYRFVYSTTPEPVPNSLNKGEDVPLRELDHHKA